MQRYFAKNIEKEKATLKESDIHHIKNVMRMNIHNKIEVVFNKKIYLCEILNNYQVPIDSISVELINEETNMPVHIAETPLDCVVLGAGKALENFDELSKTQRGQ